MDQQLDTIAVYVWPMKYDMEDWAVIDIETERKIEMSALVGRTLVRITRNNYDVPIFHFEKSD